jgi:subtilisin family serine protease
MTPPRIALTACASVLTLVSCAAAVASSQQGRVPRVAVGLAAGADAKAVSRAIAHRTGSAPERLGSIPALIAKLPSDTSLRGIRGIRYVEPLRERRLAFTPTDPLVSKQWYLPYSGFYQSWATLPAFEPIPVAVIDSGVDAGHPELAARVLDAKSFVGGSPRVDTFGHGTFVAGLIAAGVNNGVGIAGLAPSAQLLVAKVVTPSRSIPVEAEVKAIRWAVDNGARVINMSLGGIRDPLDPSRDTYSRLEADAISYAVANGVVVVAAVGNGDQAPSSPWKYASYPAALPHVLGVSATNDTGGIPKFSNRDAVYNDLAAPGLSILSILPRPLTARFPACAEQGYSSCGPEEYREAQGTSFATPQVSAAATVLLSLRPTLRPEQVTRILQTTARDLTAASGCSECALGRDALSGWGRLDVTAAIAALEGPLPARDSFEANDDAGSRAHRLTGATRQISATADFWDDQDDVYAIRLQKGQPVYVGLTGTKASVDMSLALWRPGTRSILSTRDLRFRAKVSARLGARQYLSYRARAAGTHFVQVRMSSPGFSRYRLTIVKG